MTRLLVNDCLTTIPGTKTFWHDLEEWFDLLFVGDDFDKLASRADDVASGVNVDDGLTWHPTSLIIRNASYFGPLETSKTVPTIALLQDIMEEGPGREMQREVIKSASVTVWNSMFTFSKYPTVEALDGPRRHVTIPLPVDFDLFVPGNPMGSQQAAALPDNCVLWIGACDGAAGQVKGWDIFLSIVRLNTDLDFVAVFKDRMPDYCPTNMRMYARLSHEELVSVIQACRVGLCTSRSETQHLAGIEMGACGLPLVVPPVGCYWERKGMPGIITAPSPTPELYAPDIRKVLGHTGAPEIIRAYWKKDFDRPVIRAAWEQLVEEVENGHTLNL